MFGFFGMFGRSSELRQLDAALRGAGLHARAVPDAVKLTALRQLKEAAGGRAGSADHAAAAELIGYCLLGRNEFVRANGEARAKDAEARLDAAVERGEGLDARLVLLTLHAGLTDPDVVDDYGLASE